MPTPTPNRRKKSDDFLARNMDRFRILSAVGGTAGLIAIVGFLAHIQTQLDRNCDATAAVGASVVGVVSVDKELQQPKNKALKENLIQNLKSSRERCSK